MAFIAGACVARDASGDVTEFLNGTFRNCTDRKCEFGLQNNFQVNIVLRIRLVLSEWKTFITLLESIHNNLYTVQVDNDKLS